MTLQDQFAEMARLWHPTRNGDLKPADITPGSRRKLWWRCDRGHEWQAMAYSIKAGTSCPYCFGRYAIPGQTDLVTLRPDLMEQWDPERNTLDPRETTVFSHDQAWWLCDKGHSWRARIFSRTKEDGSGCPYCTGRKVLAGFNDLGTLKPKLAKQWYQPLNGDLKPTDVTLGSNKRVWWQCSEGHVWQTYIYVRTKPRGTGCPVCAGVAKQRGSVVMPRKYAKTRKRMEKAAAGMNV